MTILCIDTATELGTVAAARDVAHIAAVRWRSASRHGENLFTHIESVLGEANVSRGELTLIGVDIGPGRFTSLRVGLATAKGLALGLDLPIVGVSSLRVLARSLGPASDVVRVPLMNAYRGEVFSAAYVFREDEEEELVAPCFGPPEKVVARIRSTLGDRQVAVCGEAVRPHAEAIRAGLGIRVDHTAMDFDTPTAKALVAEVRHAMRTTGPDDLASLEPLYLRPSDAKLPERALRTESPS